jgi:P-type Cu+ transporter
MGQPQRIEVPIEGMDCAECTLHVREALTALPGVESAQVLLSTEKAILQLDPARVDLPAIRKAVAGAGYSVRDDATAPRLNGFTRRVLTLLGIVFGAVVFVVVVGEWLGLFEQLTARVPFALGVALVLVAGYPIFVNVVRATLKRQIISHTLMTLGVLAALAIGQWATAVVVVFFMRVGDYAESFTAERARRAVKDLTALAPQTARVERDGVEVDLPVAQVRLGETVIVRPGDKIPVDGTVLAGHATVDQSALTGESLPSEAGAGAHVFAATFAQLGSLRVRVEHVGADTTFGRVIKLVEEAESQRGEVQRFADKFTAYYLPIVAGIALLTFLLRRDPLATAAVLVVACSCSIALATPIAMLASIGAAAQRGLLIKGGKYLELLARADVLLVDKTGTLTLGRPQVTDVVSLNGMPENEILALAASAERYSEHPLAEAVRQIARARNLKLQEPDTFQAQPGVGVRAHVAGKFVSVGSGRTTTLGQGSSLARTAELEREGKTLLFVTADERLIGIIASTDTLRQQVPAALDAVRRLGIRHIELLTGDNDRTAAALAQTLGVQWSEDHALAYRAKLLPEDKIRIVKEYQARGHIVVMVGDGVNDAPALAQADVGIAMGAAGSAVAIEAAHIALLRDDWNLVPEVFSIARRTLGVVKSNLLFTAIYNVAGLTLAALGFLPPIFAAAAQSLPDLGITANSARLLRQKRAETRD